MKKLRLVMIVMFVAGVTVAFGQKMDSVKWTPEAWAEKEVAKVSQVIPDLSEDQKVAIKNASIEHFRKMKAFHQENKEERSAMKEEMKNLRKEKLTTYKGTLNDDQYVKFLEWKAEHHGEGHGGERKGHKGKRH